MKFAVETWAPEYGIAVEGSEIDETTDTIDASVEVAPGEWTPISPAQPESHPTVLFVDGVQRIDARVWINDGDLVRAGVCAVVAAGSVVCTDSAATVVESAVGRFVLSAPIESARDIDTRHGLYRYRDCSSDAPEDLYLGIHHERNKLEVQLGASDEVDLVIFDGPLRGRTDPKAVGYVKTQHVQYLPEGERSVLRELDAGQRTPLFRIAGRGSSRLSWYVRLPVERTHPWAGIVRCEVVERGTDEAAATADLVTVLLPRYASEPHKDGRAPQNLYPIAGLENDLRRLLGDPLLMERALRVAAK